MTQRFGDTGTYEKLAGRRRDTVVFINSAGSSLPECAPLSAAETNTLLDWGLHGGTRNDQADRLGISISTVRDHWKRILTKLHADDRESALLASLGEKMEVDS